MVFHSSRRPHTCANSATITRQEIEARVLEGLKHRLMAPELVRAFVAEFHTEINQQQVAQQKGALIKRQRLEATSRKIASIVTAIEDGNYRKSLTERLDKLEAEKALLEADLETSEPPVLRLHPKLADIYAEKVAKLEEALNDPNIKTEASEILRSLIDKIELAPRPKGDGLDARLYGDLAQILMFCDEGERKRKLPGTPVPGSQFSVVAGARNHLYRTRLFWRRCRQTTASDASFPQL